jgi:glucose/arabinose dehydrogenase
MRYLREWDEMRRTLPLLLLIASLMWLPGPALADLPPGFSKALITGFDSPVGVAFDANGRMYVWERAGRVWLVENGVKSATPLIDISDEVGNWYEHGMLGFALHPNFLSNGWIYLFYAVDHYQLEHGSDPDYDPNASDTFVASIGRITRYTAQASTGFRTVDPASRRVLLGESPSTGCPLLYNSHGVGSLAFGADDSLLASCGDGASFVGPDTGGIGYGAYTVQALAEGIITPREDVGSFRAQLVSSLAGKLLRLDPLTGDGLPSNPFYDPADPRAARSRVFALGFRNPFRFTVRPGTGSHLKANADPGSIYLGNVGANTWEEIEVVDSPGYNGGWPIYEGMTAEAGFATVTPPANMDAPNPLFGVGGCAKPYFSFADLLIQATLATPSFPNPCDPAQQVPASIPRFVHHRPALAYGRNPGGPMMVPTFLGTLPTYAQVGAPGSPTAGTQMGGSTVSGGAWYTGTAFGAAFQNSYFQADLGGAWIVNIRFDANDQPTLVTPFETASPNATVMLATSPKGDALYAVDLFGGVYRITYAPTGNQPPVAVASASPGFGTTPLSVTFNGFGSSDPDGLPLGYSWNFGDGSPLSSSPNPTHTFFGPIGVSTTYPVTLTVTDSGGLTSVAQTVVAVNDTPPQVSITSPATQGMYPMTSSTVYPLTADISDAEQGAGQLSCRWQVTLHHNGNPEPLPVDTNCSTTATVDPLGCDGNSYFYTFALTVDDGAGLATTREVALYPNCAGLLPAICGNIDANATRNLADVSRLRTAFARPLTAPLTPGELSRCSVIGDATCDLVDLVVLRRYLAGRAPGIDAVCPAALP